MTEPNPTEPAPVAMITGAGRNIGRAIALRLAEDGYHTVLLVRSDLDTARLVADEVRARGRSALAIAADVRDAAAVGAAVAESTAVLGAVSVLVNNAALRSEQPFDSMNISDWHEVLGITLDGAFTCSQAVIGGMRAQSFGRIVNIGGVTGQTGAKHRAHVVTAKAGLLGLTKALAAELAADGITVNAVSPGLIDTARTTVPDHHRDKQIPIGRRGHPEEIAAAVSYVVSSGFLTGATLDLNGGILMR